jgi:hypothetical protein
MLNHSFFCRSILRAQPKSLFAKKLVEFIFVFQQCDRKNEPATVLTLSIGKYFRGVDVEEK